LWKCSWRVLVDASVNLRWLEIILGTCVDSKNVVTSSFTHGFLFEIEWFVSYFQKAWRSLVVDVQIWVGLFITELAWNLGQTQVLFLFALVQSTAVEVLPQLFRCVLVERFVISPWVLARTRHTFLAISWASYPYSSLTTTQAWIVY
jgi:hypothetical protein